VKWRNVWNWTGEEGGTTRLHLTNDSGFTGRTLCGREFPARKGYPTAVRYCKICIRKSGLSFQQIRELEDVPDAEDAPITRRHIDGPFAALRNMVHTECPCGCGNKEICDIHLARVKAHDDAIPF
jgi:hypothetical protein